MKQDEGVGVSLASQIRSELDFIDISISDAEMLAISDLMKRYAGITLPSDGKKLVMSRLIRRIQHHRLATVDAYLALLKDGRHLQERSLFVDALTTNETYFFREPSHFDYLSQVVLPLTYKHSTKLRVWSAAASEGQEAYSIAMTLEAAAGYLPWEVFGSDINRQVIEKAQKGIYPMDRLSAFPDQFLKKYCLKGSGPMEGFLTLTQSIKDRVKFDVLNLNSALPTSIGPFDAIFLRNVLIYFDKAHQYKIIRNVLSKLKNNGYLFVGISEHIDSDILGLKQIEKSIYQRIMIDGIAK